MEKKFGRVWQPVGALKIPTFAKEKPLGATATQGRSRRGGPLPRRLPNIKKKVPFRKAEEEEDPVLKVDAHGAHVRRTKESWEDQKAG